METASCMCLIGQYIDAAKTLRFIPIWRYLCSVVNASHIGASSLSSMFQLCFSSSENQITGFVTEFGYSLVAYTARLNKPCPIGHIYARKPIKYSSMKVYYIKRPQRQLKIKKNALYLCLRLTWLFCQNLTFTARGNIRILKHWFGWINAHVVI